MSYGMQFQVFPFVRCFEFPPLVVLRWPSGFRIDGEPDFAALLKSRTDPHSLPYELNLRYAISAEKHPRLFDDRWPRAEICGFGEVALTIGSRSEVRAGIIARTDVQITLMHICPYLAPGQLLALAWIADCSLHLLHGHACGGITAWNSSGCQDLPMDRRDLWMGLRICCAR